jgi:branched-chain amino acid transport system permease protein
LSLASPGFYAVGGYTAAIMSTRYVKLDFDTGFWKFRALGRTFTFSRELYDIRLVAVEMVIAAAIAAVLGVILGYLALRLSGIYLALATIAFVECFRLINFDHPIFGGATGIFDIPQPFDSQLAYLWLALPLLVLAAWFVYRQERARVGRALVAINEDELAASATGIHPTYYKVLAFTQGAILAALAGVISAHLLNTWNARQGTFDASTLMLACVVIGGSRTFVGPILGGFALTAIPELLRWVADRPFLPKAVSEPIKNGRPFVYGLLMVLVCIYFSQGLATPGIVDRLFPRAKRRPSGLPASDPATSVASVGVSGVAS